MSAEKDPRYRKRRYHRESIHDGKRSSDLGGHTCSAEHEVVSVFVSAMMGYIVERWDGVPLIDKEGIQIDVPESEESTHVESGKTESTIKQIEVKKTRRELCKVSSSLLSSKSQDLQKQSSQEEVIDESDSKQTEFSVIQTSILSSLEIITDIILSGTVQDALEEWRFQEKDEQAVIKFCQGNRYEGTISRSLMHGQGTFYWADGGYYKGEFRYGEITGKGKMEWPDLSWYEGRFYKGQRHGPGTLVINSSMNFTGNYCMGKKDGPGYISYDDSQKASDSYNGQWAMGKKQGTGLRIYKSGSRYIGHWHNNQRHGLGTMVWSNNDVYSGNWSEGKMAGYGEYTWSTFFNKHFVIPNDNCYYGEWDNGLRHGRGTLELLNGTAVRGNWQHGLKEGSGQIVCCNGMFVYSENLFVNDSVQLGIETPSDTARLTITTSAIPINAATHDIDISGYLERLVQYRQYCKLMKKPFRHVDKNAQNRPQVKKYFLDIENEEKWLSNVLKRYYCILKQIYKHYAEIAYPTSVTGTTLFKPVMARIMLWQMFRDCGFHNRGLSLADIDIIIAKNKATLMESYHYPFERIQFWQFLHCLIELSWIFYVEHQVSTDQIPGILGSALNKLINCDILPNSETHVGNVLFKYRDLLPLEAVYNLYRNFGNPNSARVMLKAIMTPDTGETPTSDTPVPKGINAVGVGGKLMYLIQEEHAVDSGKSWISQDKPMKTDLTCVADIGLQAVMKCFTNVCPGTVEYGLYVNMDYKMVFLEFYEVLLLCAVKSVMLELEKEKQRMLEEQEKANNEENQKETNGTDGEKHTPESKPTTLKSKKNLNKTRKSDKKKKKSM